MDSISLNEINNPNNKIITIDRVNQPIFYCESEIFISVMNWVENLWRFISHHMEFKNLNIKIYGGIIRYMITKIGAFNDLDLYIERDNKEMSNKEEIDLNNKIESLFYLLHKEGLITEYTKRWFTNFNPPLLNFKFKIIMYDRNPFGLTFDAELLTGKPYNPESKIDFVLNNFCLGRDMIIEVRIKDKDIPNNNSSIIKNEFQEFLLKFRDIEELTNSSDCVGELFKMYRLFLMYSRGYNIICNSKIPEFDTKQKTACKICRNRNGTRVLLECGHYFHPYCIFQAGKNKNPYTKGYCPSCNYSKLIKLKLSGSKTEVNRLVHLI